MVKIQGWGVLHIILGILKDLTVVRRLNSVTVRYGAVKNVVFILFFIYFVFVFSFVSIYLDISILSVRCLPP